MPCGDPICPRCGGYVYVGDDGLAHCGCSVRGATWTAQPVFAERIAALERRVAELEQRLGRGSGGYREGGAVWVDPATGVTRQMPPDPPRSGGTE